MGGFQHVNRIVLIYDALDWVTCSNAPFLTTPLRTMLSDSMPLFPDVSSVQHVIA